MKRFMLTTLAAAMFGCQPYTSTESDKWIVESKNINGRAQCVLELSDAGNPTDIIRIEVGEHTFDRVSVGDTLDWRIKH